MFQIFQQPVRFSPKRSNTLDKITLQAQESPMTHNHTLIELLSSPILGTGNETKDPIFWFCQRSNPILAQKVM